MLIQVLQNITLPNGVQLRQGQVLHLAEVVAAKLVELGQARERDITPALETTGGGIPRPPKTTAKIDSPTTGLGGSILSWQDKDNFVKNMVTVAVPATNSTFEWPDDGDPSAIVIPLTLSLSAREPVLTIDEIKYYLRIDPDYTVEDVDIQRMERSAHASCENALRRVGQIDATCGENIKQAMLWGVEILYEHRDPTTLPDGFSLEAMFRLWLPGEVDYPTGVY